MLNELYDEETGLEEVADQVELPDEMAVRSALVRIAQLERDAQRVENTKHAVAESYDAKIDGIRRQIAFLRDGLQGYVEREGKVSFPDAGTAYLQRSDPKIEVEDKAALEAEIGPMFTKPVFDLTEAKRYALEQATTEGVILPGCKLIPGGPSLRIRKA